MASYQKLIEKSNPRQSLFCNKILVSNHIHISTVSTSVREFGEL